MRMQWLDTEPPERRRLCIVDLGHLDYEKTEVDCGIAKQLTRLNNFGMRTRFSCSGMKKDGHKTKKHRKNKKDYRQTPYIVFQPVYNENGVLNEKYERCIYASLAASGFDLMLPDKEHDTYPNDITGFINNHITDSLINYRFNKLVSETMKRKCYTL